MSKNPASDVGQWIGTAFEKAVIKIIQDYLEKHYPDYQLRSDQKKTVNLQMAGGLSRQVDNIIQYKFTQDPIALLETKWLKDGRHHNDKGAWILQLREIRKNYPTIRGSVAILAGYWTEGIAVMLQQEGKVKMILVANDEEIYQTLQKPLDHFWGTESFELDPKIMRQSYPEPEKILALLQYLDISGEANTIIDSWFSFERQIENQIYNGKTLIYKALDELLQPLPSNLQAISFEITLEINSGNLIHQTFTDLEEAMAFLITYASDIKAIAQKITPRLHDEP